MIPGIGPNQTGRLDAVRSAPVQRGTPAPKAGTVGRDSGAAVSSTAADMAAAGPPIDTDKVARIRSAIADGSYAIDAQAIADRMVELDLPVKP